MNWNISQWLQSARRAFGSRYVRLLEDDLARLRDEIARLRLENRALLNSLLGTAGVPPVEDPRPAPQPIAPVRRHFWRPQS
jgi:hypothetical protein